MDVHIIIRPTEENDRLWMREVMRKWWGSDTMIIRKTEYEPAEMAGSVDLLNGERVGLVVLRYEKTLCEIMSLTTPGTHPQVGSQLMFSAIENAKKHGIRRIVVITTNDNTNALRFYQKMGFYFRKLQVGIVEESGKIKPQIPLVGNFNIPIRDEIELEMFL